MFMREGTPSGFSTMSTGVPSSRYGMSSTGMIVDTTPLLPWRPAILSPGCTRRFTARYTFTIFKTPGARSSPAVVLANLLQLRLLDRERARVFLDAVAREHAHVDDGAVHAGRHAQRGVLNVGRLLAKDRAQPLLFRRQLGFAFRCHLADQN